MPASAAGDHRGEDRRGQAWWQLFIARDPPQPEKIRPEMQSEGEPEAESVDPNAAPS